MMEGGLGMSAADYMGYGVDPEAPKFETSPKFADDRRGS